MTIRSEIETNLHRTLAELETLRAAAMCLVTVHALVIARAAGGEVVLDSEWLAIELELENIARRVARLQLVFAFLEREIAGADAPAADIAEALAFTTPVAGNA